MSARPPLQEFVPPERSRFGLAPIPSLTAFMSGTATTPATLPPPDPAARLAFEPPLAGVSAGPGPGRRPFRRRAGA